MQKPRGLGFNQSDESDRVPLVSKNKDDDDFQLWKQARNGVVSPRGLIKIRVGRVKPRPGSSFRRGGFVLVLPTGPEEEETETASLIFTIITH